MNDLTEDQKKALKGFKKRLKAYQLEEDSKLGRAKVSHAHDTITAIQPPSQYPREVWAELVAKGYLIDDGRNFFKLVPGK